ncbi:MAG: cation:proton antiporter [Clostridia bacterium]|nr:cation:proton antiporter [Clostridia bacterium]
MLNYHFLLDLAIILIGTKFLGIITRKIQMPQVVGALLAGLILGPAVLGWIHETEFIKQMAELGVIVLMFNAGLETDLNELKKCGKASFIIALFGVLVPLAGGFGIAMLFNSGNSQPMNTKLILENIFIGIVLTATSVSITVETLRELGKLNTPSGTAILGAALIDDILGIIALTIITSVADSSVSLGIVLLKILGFFVFALAVGIPFYFAFHKYSEKQRQRRRFVIIAFSFCLTMSFIAEHFFGVANITGAFIAGLVISNTTHSHYINRRFDITSYVLLSPIFFASIGVSVSLTGMNSTIIIFSILLLVVAILSKIIGCGIEALACKYSRQESLRIGVGMISRGEVALIVASKGAAVGLINTLYFGPIIVMVVVTTIITPILLKLVYSRGKNEELASAS